MNIKTKINITDKELDRDIMNLSIPWEDQHIPYVPMEEMDCYSEAAKAKFRQLFAGIKRGGNKEK